MKIRVDGEVILTHHTLIMRVGKRGYFIGQLRCTDGGEEDWLIQPPTDLEPLRLTVSSTRDVMKGPIGPHDRRVGDCVTANHAGHQSGETHLVRLKT